jgi:hypothetical protein
MLGGSLLQVSALNLSALVRAALIRGGAVFGIGAASDLELLLRVMAGGDGIDPNVRELAVDDAGAVKWPGRRVLLLPAPRIAWLGRQPLCQVAAREGNDHLTIAAAAALEVAQPPWRPAQLDS